MLDALFDLLLPRGGPHGGDDEPSREDHVLSLTWIRNRAASLISSGSQPPSTKSSGELLVSDCFVHQRGSESAACGDLME